MGLGAEGCPAGPGLSAELAGNLGWAPALNCAPFPGNLRRREGEAGGQSWSQRGLFEGFGVSAGFLFDCWLGRRAGANGKRHCGHPGPGAAAVLCSAPPTGECAPPARLCGAAVGGRGERDHLRPEPLSCTGRGSGRE